MRPAGAPALASRRRRLGALTVALALAGLPAAAQQEGPLTAPAPASRPDTIRAPAAAQPEAAAPAAAPADPAPSVPPSAAEALPDGPQPGALLRGLDTFSGHVADFVVGVGGRGQFERLIVTVEACHVVDGGVDAYAFVTIADDKAPDQVIFRGWMVASSPALSALDHPRYDVWLQSCSTRSG